ncbi:hypothetical protein COLO4_12087 [Corchorus olitorius]|uniref:Uncharacterized protein n=1 Tax=Corchorus olitorius TaxID=93759 RepID=A0A1R3K286_9ROSI|nr:hypothetical protein COLO4_12087 [Corchorus olitorius]
MRLMEDKYLRLRGVTGVSRPSRAVTPFFGLCRGRYVTVAAVTHATRTTV